eukprot:6798043-Ditylum_brightwellii.AAC.1
MRTTWISSTDNELGCLAAGIPGQVEGSNTIGFIRKNAIPKGKKITYTNMVCDYKPLKEEKYRVRLTIGGDKLIYNDETASPAASLLKTKIIVSITISDAHKGACFMGIDIKNYFLQTYLPPGQR